MTQNIGTGSVVRMAAANPALCATGRVVREVRCINATERVYEVSWEDGYVDAYFASQLFIIA